MLGSCKTSTNQFRTVEDMEVMKVGVGDETWKAAVSVGRCNDSDGGVLAEGGEKPVDAWPEDADGRC